MAMPHHRTFPTEEQGRHPQRSLLHRTRLQRPRLPPRSSQTARRSLRRAVWRNPKSVPTASVVVASERIPGSTAARHAHSAVLLRGCMPPRARLTHCPPALLHGAPCGAHTLQRHEYTDVALLRTPPAARNRGGAVLYAHADAQIPPPSYTAVNSQCGGAHTAQHSLLHQSNPPPPPRQLPALADP